MVKYEHDDSGLGVVHTKIKKFENFRELHEINQEVNQKQEQSKSFRRFKEYESITDGELIITIEYW
jgi:hypothetical protein